MPFQSTANTLSDKERALQKEHCRSFAENGRGPDSQYPLNCAPAFLALGNNGYISTFPCLPCLLNTMTCTGQLTKQFLDD